MVSQDHYYRNGELEVNNIMKNKLKDFTKEEEKSLRSMKRKRKTFSKRKLNKPKKEQSSNS